MHEEMHVEYMQECMRNGINTCGMHGGMHEEHMHDS